MRTFPKALAKFREVIDERGKRLRELPYEEVKQLAGEPIEHILLESRPATIAIIVQTLSDGGLRVVIQGFMKFRFILGKNVALDGFYKYPDGTVTSDAGRRILQV